MNLALPGCTFCICHGGGSQANANEQISKSNYQLTKWQAKLQRQRDSAGIKNLRDEIGILRMILEETLNQCGSEKDLILYSARISDLVSKVEKLVASCHKLEGSMGNLLDKGKILNFATQVVNIIGEVFDDPERIDLAADRILSILTNNTDTD